MDQDDVRRERSQFRRVPANFGGIGTGPAHVDPYVAADGPAQLPQRLQERPDAGLKIWIAGGYAQEYADVPHALGLLRARGARQRRGSRSGDERAPLHSITSPARACSVCGTVRPSVLAVLRLMTSSYLVGVCTGRSAGFSPLRMRST